MSNKSFEINAIKTCKNILKKHLHNFDNHYYYHFSGSASKSYHMLVLLNNRNLTHMPRNLAKLCFDLDKEYSVIKISNRRYCKINFDIYLSILNKIFPIIIENSVIKSDTIYQLLKEDVIMLK